MLLLEFRYCWGKDGEEGVGVLQGGKVEKDEAH